MMGHVGPLRITCPSKAKLWLGKQGTCVGLCVPHDICLSDGMDSASHSCGMAENTGWSERAGQVGPMDLDDKLQLRLVHGSAGPPAQLWVSRKPHAAGKGWEP